MAQSSSPPPALDPIVNDTVVEVDDDDSAFGDSMSQSDWTSVTSSIYKGVFEHGRRYQALKQDEYCIPIDSQQYESAMNNHLATLLHDQDEENQFFRAPINLEGGQILDIGCGEGQWALDVADSYPGLTVQAVDLHPSPQPWTAPNCLFEVDDVTKPWTWTQKFDLVHMRWMVGSFTDEEWKDVYRKAYAQLKLGGWIEHTEYDLDLKCDDHSIEPGSTMAAWVPLLNACAERMGRRVQLTGTMLADIEEAGFTNVHVQQKKFPIGNWARDPVYKEIGLHEVSPTAYVLYLLTCLHSSR